MKHLKIYEKFESNILSKTVNFLEKKINKKTSIFFVKELKEYLHNIFDIPLSYITDEDILYLNKEKALLVNKETHQKANESDYSNIDYIKFWFSTEKGLVTVTSTGIDTLKGSYRQNKNKLNSELFEKLKSETGLEKGVLTEVEDYSLLEHLDKIVGIFSSDNSQEFQLATFFKEGSSSYAIQDKSDGGEPTTRQWRSYGRYSWALGDISNNGAYNDDHHYLHVYNENSDELNIVDSSKAEEHDVYKYNLRLDKETGIVNNKYRIQNLLKETDFALVISVGDLIKKVKNLKVLKGERLDQKKDALKLISDDDLKAINIDRYINRLFDNYGISKDNLNLKNFQKVVSKLCYDKYALFRICMPTYNTEIHPVTIRNMTSAIKKVIINTDKSELERLYEYSIKYYKSVNNNYRIHYNYFKDGFDLLKKLSIQSNDEQIIYIVELLEKISNYINDYILAQSINTIYELDNIRIFIDNINQMIGDSENLYIHNSNLQLIIINMNDLTEIKYHFRYLENGNKSIIINGLESMLKNIKRKY